jgi:biopolymer transport protein ExbD
MAGPVGVPKGPRSDINVTPLVDVVLVLLIIFMVLTPLLEKELAVRVPEESELTPPPPPDEIPDQWVMRVDADGKFILNNNPLTDDTAVDELKKVYRYAKTKDPKPIIFFDADDKAKYVRAMRALDMIRDSSPADPPWIIGMMTERPGGLPGATPGAAPAPEAPK